MAGLYGENGPTVNLDEVMAAVREAEVLIIGFPLWSQRLLLDLRADTAAPALVELVAPLQSAAERASWLARRRPTLGPVERSVFFTWPHSVDLLERSGLPARVVERVGGDHGLRIESDMRAVFGQLRMLERECLARAIEGGDGFETLWKARR